MALCGAAIMTRTMTDDRQDSLARHPITPIATLLTDDETRLEKLSFDIAGLYVDFSKTHLDDALIDHFIALASDRRFGERREALFSGGIVNPTEGRPAEHVAERGQGAAEAVEVARVRRERMRALIDAIEAGAFGQIDSVVHIGIGGSLLGPALLVDSLGRRERRVEVRFLSNVDGQAFDDAVRGLDPASTLVVAVSKTFTTTETLSNLDAVLGWLRSGGVSDAFGRVVAVTASPDAALEQGVDETRILQFAQGVGGRYSLWSAVGISAALALGWDSYEALIEGAGEMDRHFRFTDPARNLPLIAAFVDQLYTRRFDAQTRAVFAYDERLRLLPDYLQQLEMESNGKSATANGRPLVRPSAPITWGGVGTDAQHAVFQLLHQGSHLVPVEFVAVVENEDSMDPRHHALLLGNCFAQGAALMAGRQSDDAARAYRGDRPSITILLDRLDPRTLGALLAFYEHRTFANAVLIGINPFDQYGVELGKDMARRLDDEEARATFDPSTRALIGKAGL